jgi:hypothetical protein
MMRVAVGLLTLAVVLVACRDPARERFFEELEKTYDYLPADVDKSVREAGAKKTDRFAEFVGSDLEKHLPLLREALGDKDRNAFFYYDGSALLIKHSPTRADYAIAVDAIRRCRLQDVAPEAYFSFAHEICQQDVDAYPIVVKMLENPEFGFELPQHAMRVQQRDAVLLCLTAQGEDRWVARLAARLEREKDPLATHTILSCLAAAVAPEAKAALKRFIEREDADPGLQAFASAIVWRLEKEERPPVKLVTKRETFEAFLEKFEAQERMPEADRQLLFEGIYLVRREDEARLRALRRRVARRVSGESLRELAYLTQLLRCSVRARE